MTRYLIIYLLSISIWTNKISAQVNIDSLKQISESNAHDTIRTQALLDICWNLKSSEPGLALIFGEKALDLSRKTKTKIQEATALKNIGTIYLFLSNYSKAENYYSAAISIYQSIRNNKGLAGCYNNLGLIQEQKGNFDQAMKYYEQSLLINEKINNKPGIASSQTNIGNILQEQGNYRNAISYYLKALKIKEELNEKAGIADAYNNIGALYEKQGAYEQAIKNYEKALMLYVEIDEKKKSGLVLHNLGYIQNCLKQYETAMDYYEKSLEIKRSYGDKQGIASTYMNIGEIYYTTGKLKDSEKYYNSALSIFNEIGNQYGILEAKIALAELNCLTKNYSKAISQLNPILKEESLLPEDLKQVYHILAQANFKTNNLKPAYEYLEKYIILKDSLGKEDNTKTILQIQLDYEFQKKQKEAEILREKQQIHDESELNKRKMIIYILILCLVAFVLIVILIYRSYLIKRKDNEILESQKKEIGENNNKLILYQEELLSQKENLEVQKNLIITQRDMLEEKNQRINDSIKYAQRIQTSMLPPDDFFSNRFKDYFILFKPKDIVSGDFYWLKETETHILVAVADCTGHGVPGAFMSLLSISFLNEIVDSGIINTGEILGLTRERIKKTLHQYSTANEPRDGMDIGLCAIDKTSKILQFSGAYNSLLIINESVENQLVIQEIAGDKMTIGSQIRKEGSFTVHSHPIGLNDRFYLFTDGYIDQFGGIFDRKFLPKRFKETLIETKAEEMLVQKSVLAKNLEKWMDGREQIDDILVLGFKY